MNIETPRRTYLVKLHKIAPGSIIPVVHVRSKFLFFKYWRWVWFGMSKRPSKVNAMSDAAIETWFKDAVARYERYEDARNKYPEDYE